MADISNEIKNFRDAIYGEEVRESMISLAEKLNDEVEGNTGDVNVAVSRANSAAQNANDAAAGALVGQTQAVAAALEAQNAAQNAEAIRSEVQSKLIAGEFIGPVGPPGKDGEQGAQGESGVVAPSSGMFMLKLDPETGNLYAAYPDGEIPPQFRYEIETGNLYYVINEKEA